MELLKVVTETLKRIRDRASLQEVDTSESMVYYKFMDNIQILTLTQKNFEKELRLLRSFVIGMAGKDTEGNYRPEFIQKILNLVNEQSAHTFKNSQVFLRSLEKYSQ